jgi:DNA-binding NarL/FixJ family response regulator
MRRVLLVEDHQVVRDGLKSIFREQEMSTEFDEACTGAAALELARDRKWDLAVVDISLGDKSGLDVVRAITLIHPRLPILVLSIIQKSSNWWINLAGCRAPPDTVTSHRLTRRSRPA